MALSDKTVDALRADLQQVYGIDLDHAMAGEHTPNHIGALVCYLPNKSHVRVALDADASWTREEVILASIQNNLRGLIWGMTAKKDRGPEPMPIGPSWLTASRWHSLPTRAMPIDELMEILNLDRRDTNGG